MNPEDVDKVVDRLERIVFALNRQKTIVPIFIYIPQAINVDDLEKIGGFITEKLAKAGFNVGEEPAP